MVKNQPNLTGSFGGRMPDLNGNKSQKKSTEISRNEAINSKCLDMFFQKHGAATRTRYSRSDRAHAGLNVLWLQRLPLVLLALARKQICKDWVCHHYYAAVKPLLISHNAGPFVTECAGRVLIVTFHEPSMYIMHGAPQIQPAPSTRPCIQTIP